MENLQFHEKMMRRALSLAKRAWGKTSPNPMVGAMVVHEGVIVGEGYHHAAGEPHAEVNALRAAGARAHGADLYVTLEPCSSFGRTPPCTQAIINAGIRTVYIACLDPNPKHAGAALAILKQHGIEVHVGILQREALQLNEAFFFWIRNQRPFVLLKMAQTLDGKIATSQGCSHWITSEKARERVQYLRRWADAICVGGETARNDSPKLNVRSPKNWKNQPLRLVATRSMDAVLLQKMMPGLPEPKPIDFFDREHSLKALQLLGAQNVTALLVEGGGELAATLLEQHLVQKVEFHIAPKILGGRHSRSSVAGNDPHTLLEAYPLYHTHLSSLGDDFQFTAYLEPLELNS